MSQPSGQVTTTGAWGVMYAMWIPCVAFAHVFAASWLLKTLYIMNPMLFKNMKDWFKSWGECCNFKRRRIKKLNTILSCPRDLAPVQRPDHYVSRLMSLNRVGVEAVVNGPNTPSEPSENESVHSEDSAVEDLEVIRRMTRILRPLDLEWNEVGCCYATGDGIKVILEGICGRLRPCEMLALLGPSGAGKSTLLDILAMRKSVGMLTGEILVNGKPRDKPFLEKTAYVPQEDNFMPSMTVEETMWYYANLILPSKMPRRRMCERIEEVLTVLGLTPQKKTLVGGFLPGGIYLRGLSGGERKRLCIGVGVLATPSIIFLDEPTSGLDSFAALNVMQYLRGMANIGHGVCASIHQPRSAIWQTFDTVLILSKGLMMYFGSREGMVPWFTRELGYSYNPELHGVASDWVLDLVNVSFHKPKKFYGHTMNTTYEVLEAARRFTEYMKAHMAELLPASSYKMCPVPVKDVEQGYPLDEQRTAAWEATLAEAVEATQQSPIKSVTLKSPKNAVAGAATGAKPPSACGGVPMAIDGGLQRASWFRQFRTLLWREVLNITRNPADVAGRMLISTWVAILTGLIFYDLGADVGSLRGRLNVLFVELTIFMLLPYVNMSLYTSDKKYYVADVSSRLYQPSAFYVSKVLAVLPFSVLTVLVYSWTLYGMAGLRHSAFAIIYNGIMSVFIYLIAAQVLYFAAVITPNQDSAFMLSIAWTALNMLLSNFMIRFEDMKFHWLSQLRYISALQFTFQGYVDAEFKDVQYSCAGGIGGDVISYLPIFLPKTTILNSSIVRQQLANPGADCILDANGFLDYFGLTLSFGALAGILITYLTVVHLLTYSAFVWVSRKEAK